MKDETERIINEMKTLLDQQGLISASKVREWISSPDREVRGAVFNLLFEHPDRVEPLLFSEEKNKFFLNYLEQCLREDAQGLYAEGRYAAGDTLRAFFQQMWRKNLENQQVLQNVRNMLARLCYEKNSELNEAIITTTLEHLFVNPQIITFFSNWDQDQYLKDIYEESIALASQQPQKGTDS